ncbi:MAG: flagellin [Candidatus Poseidoniaceae archaeon]|nr:flagellin [Candidatus Poseidoniaceae archaeon]
MKNEMKNEMNENSDDLAAIGIGAMIVFIALILVAAVAAAVIIQTAEKLQQNAQATGDDTQEQMSTKVILLSTVIESTTALFSTFELAPGSEAISSDGIGYIVICDTGGANAVYAEGSFTDATIHTGDGATTGPITLNPGTTYVVSLDITGCSPVANADNIMVISVNGGGNTYEELQYGSSPSVGDVVV